MHRGFSRSNPGIATLVLANSVIGASPLTASLPERRLCGYVLSARGRQRGYCRVFTRACLIERSESRRPLRAGFLHLVGSHKLQRQQRFEPFQVFVGVLELRLQARDLGVGDNRVHLPPRNIGGGGIELSLCL